MFKRQSTLSLVMIAMFAALTAIGAFIKIPLPVVPFTLQIVFVFLAGSLLGSRNGLQSQLVYIGVGLVGLPVLRKVEASLMYCNQHLASLSVLHWPL